ncbi:hypothetical protein Fcan01_13310 [Folsomia candida]|uniref:Uncharacterized protein n=1 Tax=Folsomia candida TaxID=158441 RepID=A0A226E4Q7_FOLCA|nr:hypothetical protein Fcan01_13310 [Folsomia candida]
MRGQLSSTLALLLIFGTCSGRPVEEEDQVSYENRIIFPSDVNDQEQGGGINSRIFQVNQRKTWSTTTPNASQDSWIVEDDDDLLASSDKNKNVHSSSEHLLIMSDDDGEDPSASVGFRRNSHRQSQLQILKSSDPCEIGFRHRFSAKGGGKMNKCPPRNVKG